MVETALVLISPNKTMRQFLWGVAFGLFQAFWGFSHNFSMLNISTFLEKCVPAEFTNHLFLILCIRQALGVCGENYNFLTRTNPRHLNQIVPLNLISLGIFDG